MKRKGKPQIIEKLEPEIVKIINLYKYPRFQSMAKKHKIRANQTKISLIR